MDLRVFALKENTILYFWAFLKIIYRYILILNGQIYTVQDKSRNAENFPVI